MPTVELIPPSRADPELRRAYARARTCLGFRRAVTATPAIIRGLCHRPRLLTATFEAYAFACRWGDLPRATRELAAALVAREVDCFY